MVKNDLRPKQGSVESHYERLEKIKNLVDNQGGHTWLSLFNICKGSSATYTILMENKILIPTDDGLIWNTKIPLSRKLAETIREKTREYHVEAKIRYTNKKLRKSQGASTITTKVKQSSRRVKSTQQVVNTPKKRSFLWGLISWEV